MRNNKDTNLSKEELELMSRWDMYSKRIYNSVDDLNMLDYLVITHPNDKVLRCFRYVFNINKNKKE